MFWLAVIGLGLGGYMLFSVSEGIGFGGKPTPTKAGAEDDKGPQLRQYVDNLYAKLKAQGPLLLQGPGGRSDGQGGHPASGAGSRPRREVLPLRGDGHEAEDQDSEVG